MKYLLCLIIYCFPLNDLYSQWVETFNANGVIRCMSVNGSKLFVGTSDALFLSTNSGESWKPLTSISAPEDIGSLAVIDSNIFCGMYRKIMHSTDNGLTWSNYFILEINGGFESLVLVDTKLYAGTSSDGIYYSIDNGLNWYKINNPLLKNANCFAVTGSKKSGYKIFAGTYSGIFLSTDNGVSWAEMSTGLTNKGVFSLVFNGENLYAGTFSGVFVSTNYGTTWDNIGLVNEEVWTLAVNNGILIAGIGSGGVFVYKDKSKIWMGRGLNNLGSGIMCFATVDQNLFVGTHLKGLWRRSLSEVLTVSRRNNRLPNDFQLFQNYPNPFNPNTTISFIIPTASHVTLKIYDILGRELSTIVNEQLDAGEYSKVWDAKEYTSGIYVYTLQSGLLSATKKLLLQK
jgi:photosystem II stability/assembly factor-like uncharacterized protein